MPDEYDRNTDNICVWGDEDPHIWRGPDRDTVLTGVAKRDIPATYNGHPTQHGICPRHARQHLDEAYRGHKAYRERMNKEEGGANP